MRCNVIKVRNSKIDWKSATKPIPSYKPPKLAVCLIPLLISAILQSPLLVGIAAIIWAGLIIEVLILQSKYYLLTYLQQRSLALSRAFKRNLQVYQDLLAHKSRIESRLDIDINSQDLHRSSLLSLHREVVSLCNYPLLSLPATSSRQVLSRLRQMVQKTKVSFVAEHKLLGVVQVFRIYRLYGAGIRSQSDILSDYLFCQNSVLKSSFQKAETGFPINKLKNECITLCYRIQEMDEAKIRSSLKSIQKYQRMIFATIPHTKEPTPDEPEIPTEIPPDTELVQEMPPEDPVCWVFEGHGGFEFPVRDLGHVTPERRLIKATLDELKQNLRPIKAKTLYKVVDSSGEVQAAETSTLAEIVEEEEPVCVRARPQMDFLMELKSHAKPKIVEEVYET